MRRGTEDDLAKLPIAIIGFSGSSWPAAEQAGLVNLGGMWHFGHNQARNGYLGPSHARCNLAAAAVTNDRRPLPHVEERPYRWSRRWFDDPPVGTIAQRDIYMGNGDWQPLED